MHPHHWPAVNRAGCAAALVSTALVAAAASAQPDAPRQSQAPGRIDFDDADLPPASVEINLSQDTFKNLFTLGDAALAGVVESLTESVDGREGAEGTRMAADQLAAAREVVQLASQVVQEARMRVYEDETEGLIQKCEAQLREGGWETVVRALERDKVVRVATLSDEGALRGVFVAVDEGDDAVLVNVVCEVSPEKVKRLSSAAVKIGMENGLDRVIEAKMRELRQRHGPHPPEVENTSHETTEH